MSTADYYYMPLFRPGASVRWGTRHETVSHVVLRRSDLLVYLKGHDMPVHPKVLQVEPTAFHLTRQPDHLYQG